MCVLKKRHSMCTLYSYGLQSHAGTARHILAVGCIAVLAQQVHHNWIDEYRSTFVITCYMHNCIASCSFSVIIRKVLTINLFVFAAVPAYRLATKKITSIKGLHSFQLIKLSALLKALISIKIRSWITKNKNISFRCCFVQ